MTGKNKSHITVLIVNYNTADFIEASLLSLYKLSTLSHRVLICDNGSKKKDTVKLKQITRNYNNVELFFRQQSEYGSVGHGEALDFLLAKVSTPYTLILDADCVILRRHWDVLLTKMISQTVPIIGTPPIAEQKHKPLDFPLMYAVLLETKIFFNLGISMKPDITKKRDTGFQMREKYLEAGYQAIVFDSKNTRYDQSGLFGKTCYCTEYYTGDDSVIIACHFSRGSSLGAAKYKSLFYRIPVLGRMCRHMKGTFDKQQWLSRCYDIIHDMSKE